MIDESVVKELSAAIEDARHIRYISEETAQRFERVMTDARDSICNRRDRDRQLMSLLSIIEKMPGCVAEVEIRVVSDLSITTIRITTPAIPL